MSIEVPIGSRVSPGGAQGPQGTRGEFLPIGTILPYAGQTAPEGYLICDGESYARSEYPELAEVCRTTYGGDEDNFNVPDLRARAPVGIGPLDGSHFEFELGEKWGEYEHALTIAELAIHNHGDVDINHNHSVGINAHGHGDPTHMHLGRNTLWYRVYTWSGSDQGWGAYEGYNHMNTDYRATGILNAGNMGGWTDYVSERAANHHIRPTNNAGNGAAHNNCQPSLGVNYIIKT